MAEAEKKDKETEAVASEAPASATPEKDDLQAKKIRELLTVGIVAGIIVAVVFVILGITSYLTSLPELRWKVLNLIGLTETADEIRYGKATGDLEGAAEHTSVVNWVLSCTKSTALADLPANVRRIYTTNARLVAIGTTATELPKDARIPHRQERAFLEFSNTLAGQRTLLRERVRSAYSFWQWSALITIALGMATTVAVSLSATAIGKGEGAWQSANRVVAIILPILSTAFAAVVAFYSPQAEWSQAARTNSSISQLHGQMALGVWKLRCSEASEPADPMQAQLEDWSRRYVDIQIIATAVGQANPTNTSTGMVPEGKPPTPPTGQQGGQNPKQ